MLPDWTIVGFTGHRDLKAPDLTAASIKMVLDELEKAHGPLAAICSAASGADTLFVEELARRNIPFFLVLPFAPERFKQDFDEAGWRRIEPLLQRALTIAELPTMQTPQEAYLETGVLTVDRADVMVAVWNGQTAAGVGGTADIVAYARTLEKPLIVIDAGSGALTRERLESLPRNPKPMLPGSPRETVEAHFRELDNEATRLGPHSRQFVLYVILLHLIASMAALAAMTPAFQSHWGIAMGIIELTCLAAAVFLLLPHRHSHHRWLQSRIGAELCRAYLALWKLKRREDPFPAFAMQGFERLWRSLRVAWYLDRDKALPLEESRDDYRQNRVLDQLNYFRKHGTLSLRRVELLKMIAWIATIGAIVTTLWVVVSHLLHNTGRIYWTIKVFSLVLPLLNAAALSLIISHDLARRATRYREMTARLEGIDKRLQAARTWSSLLRIVGETEELLLQEVSEWRSITLVTGESH